LEINEKLGGFLDYDIVVELGPKCDGREIWMGEYRDDSKIGTSDERNEFSFSHQSMYLIIFF